MAIIKGPFFSEFASGSVWKQLTVNAHYKNNRFVAQKYKSRSGKRHEIQIINAEVFASRAKSLKGW